METSMMIFLLCTRVTPPVITPVNQLSILVRLQSRVRSSGTAVDGLDGFLFFLWGMGVEALIGKILGFCRASWAVQSLLVRVKGGSLVLFGVRRCKVATCGCGKN